MITRLLAIAITGIVLMGYAPRWLTTSREAWIIWVVAAAIVLGGPRLVRRAGGMMLDRARILRMPTSKLWSKRQSALDARQ